MAWIFYKSTCPSSKESSPNVNSNFPFKQNPKKLTFPLSFNAKKYDSPQDIFLTFISSFEIRGIKAGMFNYISLSFIIFCFRLIKNSEERPNWPSWKAPMEKTFSSSANLLSFENIIPII